MQHFFSFLIKFQMKTFPFYIIISLILKYLKYTKHIYDIFVAFYVVVFYFLQSNPSFGGSLTNSCRFCVFLS